MWSSAGVLGGAAGRAKGFSFWRADTGSVLRSAMRLLSSGPAPVWARVARGIVWGEM